MNVRIVALWDMSKDNIREFFKTHPQKDYAHSYQQLLEVMLTIFNKNIKNNNRFFGSGLFKIDEITELDFGDYQGTLIFVVPEDRYQPSIDETWYTSIEYGSCCGCDTLQGIQSACLDDMANDQQINDYIALCLDMVQGMHLFSHGGEINDV